MVTHEDLYELVAYRCSQSPMLSLYLNVEPSQKGGEQSRLKLKKMLKEAADRGATPEDIQAVGHFIELEYDWQGRGVILFSCAHDNFWRAYTVAVPVEDTVHVGPRPYVIPLIDLMDTYSRYAVVAVDKEGGRIFLFHLGELEEALGTMGEELKHHKQGGWAAERLQRRAEEIASRNLRDVADMLKTYAQNERIAWIILAGTDENVARFRELLPKSLRNNVIGQLPFDAGMAENEILEASMELIQPHHTERKKALLEEIVAQTQSGNATLGFADTLEALQEQRVYRVLLAEGYQRPGYECQSCHFLTLQERPTCPLCGGPVAHQEDIVNEFLHRALELGAEISFIPGEEMESYTNHHVGALLRY